MPLDLESHCKRFLDEIVTLSHGIRRSVLTYANNQNFEVSERLRHQLEKIRISADTILEIVTKASLTDYTVDDRLIHWLFSAELPTCLGKLKEMDNILKPIGQSRLALLPTQPLRPTEDKINAAMDFFDKHKDLFRFLVTPDVW